MNGPLTGHLPATPALAVADRSPDGRFADGRFADGRPTDAWRTVASCPMVDGA